MSIDRRRTPRAPCDLPVVWKRGQTSIEGRALDLNADGLFFRTSSIVEPNYLMDLSLELPTATLSFFGVARYIGPSRHGHGIGVKIHSISKEDRDAWMRYYRSQLQHLLETLPPGVARHLRAR